MNETTNNATVNNATMNEEVNTMNENNVIENTATMIETIESFEKKSAQGYEVVTLNYNFSAYSILKRNTTYPYIVVYQYDIKTGTWAQGYYDFDTLFACHKFIIDKTTDKDETTFYCVNFELTQGVKCKAYIEASYNQIIEYFENIKEANNISPVIVMDEELEQNESLKDVFTRIYSRDELIDKAVGMLEDDNDLFVDCVDILDSYNGFASDYRLFDMYDLDNELSDKTPTEIIELVSDASFDTNDDYFCYDGYDIYSVCDKYDHYINHTDEQEVIDNLLSNLSGIRSDLTRLDSDLLDLLEKIDEM